jgi:nicotinamidase-related amidase
MADLAVIVIDMLNTYDHEDADKLVEHVADVVEPLHRLIGMARERDDVDLMYVNDNYGDYTATRDDLVHNALNGRRPDLVEPIVPPAGVDFLQKVRHSAFYGTALAHLLRERGTETVLLAGQVTEQCILYTALDAYVRRFSIRIAREAVAPIFVQLGDAALEMMERNMRVEMVDVDTALS